MAAVRQISGLDPETQGRLNRVQVALALATILGLGAVVWFGTLRAGTKGAR